MKRALISIGISCLLIMIIVWSIVMKDSIIYTTQKLFYPLSWQLKKYSGISLPQNMEILETHYQKDGDGGEAIYVKFMLEKSEADILFANKQQELDVQNFTGLLDGYWAIDSSNVQYCIWNPYTVSRGFGRIKTQRNVYFFVMFPVDNQVTIFCTIDKLGWGISK